MRGRLARKWSLRCAVLVAVLGVGCTEAPAQRSLRMAYPHEMVTLDPHAHPDGVTRSVMSAMYEGLVRFEPGLGIRPGLADRWTTPDDFTWQIHVRDGVRFHDGRVLTADDVVASIVRARETGVRSHEFDEIERVRVLENDERMIEIRTRSRVPLLLTQLEHVAIVPREFEPSTPVGTGPYRWKIGSVQGPVVLERWDDYWARAPEFDDITIQFVSVTEELADLIQNQKVDVAAMVAERFARSYEPTAPWKVVAQPSVATTYLGVNLTRPPFDDPRVREAIDDIVDREALVAAVYPPGLATPAYSIVSPEVFGFSPAHRRSGPDPERARRLLVEAGVAPSTEVRLDYQERYEPMIAPLTAILAQAGLDVVPHLHKYESFYRRMDSMENELFLISWNFRVADASPFLEAFVHTRRPDQGLGRLNGVALSDPEIDGRIEQAARETMSEKRLELLQAVLTDVGHMHAFIPLLRSAPIALAREPFDIVGRQMRPQDVRLR